MNIKSFFAFVFFILGLPFVTNAQPQNEEYYNQYLQALLLLDFDQAEKVITTHFEGDLKTNFLQFNSLLYFDGQEEDQVSYHFYFEENNIILNTIAQLGLGNDELLHNKDKKKAFQYFFDAYTNDHKSEAIKKLCLFQILKFYNFEYAQTHQRHQKYLKAYQEIANTPIEKAWGLLYQLYFQFHSIVNDNDLIKTQKTFVALEKELQNISESSSFHSLYKSIKAIDFEYNDNVDKALELHNQVIDNSTKKPYLKYLAFRSYIRVSEIFYQKKQYDKGLNTLHLASAYKNKSDTLESSIYLSRFSAKHQEAKGDYKKATTLLNETLNKQYLLDYSNNTLQNTALEIELQTAEKEKQLLLQQEKSRKNRNLAFGLGGSLFAVALIGFLVYKNTRRKQLIAEQKALLEIKDKEKLLKDQEIATINAMIEGQEKERARVASDLHDSIGATLAAAKLQFSHLFNLKKQGIEDQDIYNKTEALLQQAYQETRALAHLKNSGVMASKGLIPAVEQLAKNASNPQLKIEVQQFGFTKKLDNEKEINLFRIIQELVTNIIKHAKATEASIVFTQHKDSLNIIIEDNGVGFTTNQLHKEGMGLSSIEKRIEFWEGTFEIDSTPNKGTNILIELPL